MTSINSNSGAMTALQMLGGTVDAREDVQNDIATGQKIASAQDNAAVWAISQMMQSDLSGYSAISDSLSLDEATVAVAAVGAERASDILIEMKELAITATAGNADFATIETQLAHKTEQLNSVISASQFNGVNLLNTDIDGNGASALTVSESLTRQGSAAGGVSTISIDSLNFEGSPNFDIENRTPITDSSSAIAALGEIEGFLRYAIEGAAAMGAAASQISDQNDFIGKLSDTVQMGISNIRDTQMEEASARLTALNVQEQLGTLSLSIANASPQTLLSIS
ncbi:flagellin [Pseudophaeobacter sp.]|uniref:flagellin N-terminal helical domain-containing protein n=1 Tax=Pseudophaeobacter sp. TaxID=1971739 RepID=UPI003297AA07